jgi:hypothetical protein
MKDIILVAVLLFIIPVFGKSQEGLTAPTQIDSVYIDSLEIVNGTFLSKFNEFYAKNEKSIDSNTYFVVLIVRGNENDSNTYWVNISKGNDVENDFQHLRENKSGYYKFKNSLVLIPVLYDEVPIFTRSNKKMFFFGHLEFLRDKYGLTHTSVGYKISKNKSSELKFKKLYYFKCPYSKVKSLYYRIRYRRYFG